MLQQMIYFTRSLKVPLIPKNSEKIAVRSITHPQDFSSSNILEASWNWLFAITPTRISCLFRSYDRFVWLYHCRECLSNLYHISKHILNFIVTQAFKPDLVPISTIGVSVNPGERGAGRPQGIAQLPCWDGRQSMLHWRNKTSRPTIFCDRV